MEESLSLRILKVLSGLLCALLLITLSLPAIGIAEEPAPETVTAEEPIDKEEAPEEQPPAVTGEPETTPEVIPEEELGTSVESIDTEEAPAEEENAGDIPASPEPQPPAVTGEPETTPEVIPEEELGTSEEPPVYSVDIPAAIDLGQSESFIIRVSISSGAEAVTIAADSENGWCLKDAYGNAIAYSLEGFTGGPYHSGEEESVSVALNVECSHLAGTYSDRIRFSFSAS